MARCKITIIAEVPDEIVAEATERYETDQDGHDQVFLGPIISLLNSDGDVIHVVEACYEDDPILEVSVQMTEELLVWEGVYLNLLDLVNEGGA